MRPLLIVLVGACASVGASLAVYAAIQFDEKPYVETLPGGLLRTSASEMIVGDAIDHVLDAARLPGESTEEELERSKYREHNDAWFSSPDVFGQTAERANRRVREQLDRTGQPLRIVTLNGADMPTLIFVEHEDPEATLRITNQLTSEFMTLGVATRR